MKTNQPLVHVAAPPAEHALVLFAAKLQTVTVTDRRNASERASRISLTKSNTALCTDRLTNSVLKLGTAKAANTAIIAMTTRSSIKVKPWGRYFMFEAYFA
jgi:hypothetical protein